MGTRQGASELRRRLARLCVAGAVVALVLAGFGSAAAQDEAPVRPDVFRAAASSQVASALLDRDALLPINDAFNFVAVEGTGTYESSNQTARASVLYPGNAIVSGPPLACGAFGAQAPDHFQPLIDACLQYRFPLSVVADSLEPDAATTGSLAMGSPGDPLSAEAIRAVAHAADDAATTDAAIADLRVVGLPVFGPVAVPLPMPDAPELDPTLLVIDSATSTTSQRIDDAGRLVVESTAVLEGVRLVGGLVDIGSIRSTATLVDDGRGETQRSADLQLSGVTVGGLPAEITDQGLVVGSPTGADGPIRDQLTKVLNDLLRGLGVQITTLPVEEGEEESGMGFARAGGVLVELAVDAQGLPILPGPMGDVDPNGVYEGVIQLGQTGVTGFAAHIDDPAFSPGNGTSPDLPVELGGPSGTGGGVDASAGFDDAGSDPSLGTDSAAPAPARGQRIVSVAELLAAGRVELVYLAFTLLAFAACLGPRFVLPARLPGGNP